jgi:hypothetical protein
VATAVAILAVAIVIAVVGFIVLRRRKKQAALARKEYVPKAQYGRSNNGSPPPSAIDYYPPTPTPFTVPSATLSLSQISLPSPKLGAHYVLKRESRERVDVSGRKDQ